MSEVLKKTESVRVEEGMKVENTTADISNLNSNSNNVMPNIRIHGKIRGKWRRFGYDTVEVPRIPRNHAVRSSLLFSAFKTARFEYFEKKKVMKIDDLEIEVHFKDLSEIEYVEIKENIVNSANKFKEQFGTNRFQSKEALRVYLFNNYDDYSTLGRSESFRRVFGRKLPPDTWGAAFTRTCYDVQCNSWCKLFTQKSDVDTLNHEMAHAFTYYASGYRFSFVPQLLIEGLATYIEEMLYIEQKSSHKQNDFHIKDTFDAMIKPASRKAELDEISEILNANSHLFDELQEPHMPYWGGYSLVSYLQEEDPPAIRTFLNDLRGKNGHGNAFQYAQDFIQVLHNKHDSEFKKWLECTYEVTERYKDESSNFDAVLQYGRSIPDIKKRFLIYKALIREVKDSGHLDDSKIAKLIQDLNHEVIQQNNASNDIKRFAESLVSGLMTYGGNTFRDREKCGSKCTNFNGSIFDAAKDGNLDVVKYFVEEKKVDVNTKDSDGKTPLHRAALNGHLNVIKYLIDDKHVNVDVKDNYNQTSLHEASYYGHLDAVKYLAENGADLNVKSNDNWTPLHKAAWNGKLDVVKFLVGKGVDMNVKTKNGWTSLTLAEYNGASDIVKYLRGKFFSNSNIFDAAKNGNLVAMKYFVEDGKVNVNTKDSDGKTPLHRAALNGHLNVIKYLVDGKHVNVDVKDNSNHTSLHEASYYGHLDVVKYLVEKEADLNAKSNDEETALHKAAWNGKLDVVKYLVEKGADLNVKGKNGWTPLQFGEVNGQSDIVNYLRGKSFSNSNIFDAATNGNLDEVKYFVEDRKVNVNTKDRYTKTPLHRAALNGHLNIIKYLIDGRHVAVDVRDNSNHTSLHEASYYGHLDVVKYLVEKGADLNAKSNDGETALHKAAWNGKLDVVKYLVERGADLKIKDNKGWTPLQFSEVNGQSNISNYLRTKRNRRSIGNDAAENNQANSLLSSMAKGFAKTPALITSKGHDSATVTAVPEINTTVVNGALILGILVATNYANKAQHNQPIHENLLSPRQQSMRLNKIDEDMIRKAIQQDEDKFGLDAQMDEEEVRSNKTGK